MKLVVNGRQAYAYTGGRPFDPALPCVVMIHGALHDHSVWSLAARWLAHHGYSVLAVDQPGHRRSEGPPLATVEAIADWTLALLDAAGASHASLVGHSMGSLIALEATSRAPERIQRLVMVGTAYPMKVSEALLTMAREQPLQAIEMVNALSLSTWAAKPSYPGPGSNLHGGNRALMQTVLQSCNSCNLFEHDFKLCDAYANGLQAAQRVACPVHFILGEKDQMTPPKATRELGQALKATVHPLASGHGLMQEDPEGLLRALQRALD